MNRIAILIAMVLSVLSLSSCDDDKVVRMLWEFGDYDKESISAIFDAECYTQIQVQVSPEDEGSISMTCINFPKIYPDDIDGGDSGESRLGYHIEKVGPATIRIDFKAITLSEGESDRTQVSVNGKNHKESGITNISIIRK